MEVRPVPVPIEDCLEEPRPPAPNPFMVFTYCLHTQEDPDKTRCFSPKEFNKLLTYLEDLQSWADNAEAECGVRTDVEPPSSPP